MKCGMPVYRSHHYYEIMIDSQKSFSFAIYIFFFFFFFLSLNKNFSSRPELLGISLSVTMCVLCGPWPLVKGMCTASRDRHSVACCTKY